MEYIFVPGPKDGPVRGSVLEDDMFRLPESVSPRRMVEHPALDAFVSQLPDDRPITLDLTGTKDVEVDDLVACAQRYERAVIARVAEGGE